MIHILGSAFLSFLIFALWCGSGAYLFCKSRRFKIEEDGGELALAFGALLAGLAFFMLIIGSNLLVPGRFAFPAIAVALTLISLWVIIKSDRKTQRDILAETGQLLIPVACFAVLIVIMYRLLGVWLFEGPNHDLLYYYQGALWGLEHAQWVDSEFVTQTWGIAKCNGWLVGYDCAVYRGGAYSLAGWSMVFSGYREGGVIWLSYLFCPLMFSLAVRLAIASNTRMPAGAWAVRLILTLCLAFSGPLLSALTNSNQATALVGTLLALLVVVGQIEKLNLTTLAGVIGVIAGLCTQLYGEAIVYSVAIGGGILLCRLWFEKARFPSSWVQAVFVALVGFLLAGNLAIYAAVKSVLFISGIANGGAWPTGYIGGPWWGWLGAWYAADLIGPETTTLVSIVAGGVVMLFSIVVILASRSKYPRLISVLAPTVVLSTGLIGLILKRNYAYGEHKILQLLGPSWGVLTCIACLCLMELARCLPNAIFSRLVRRLAVVPIICMALISVDFLERSFSYFDDIGVAHEISRDVEHLNAVPKGATVVFDDSAWFGRERFQKDQYLAFLIVEAGGHPVFPDMEADASRGGYFHVSLNRTFETAGRPSWLLQAKSRVGGVSCFPRSGPALYEGDSYRIFDLADSGVVVAGRGWNPAPNGRCLVSRTFDIELYAPAEGFVLKIAKPRGGRADLISAIALVKNGSVAAGIPTDGDVMTVPVGMGWQRLTVKLDKSPDAGAKPASASGT
ncbi:hypothetical protein [Silvimonas iriomotensis]|uniref:Glycosyltransferase RgtA/B/C/D-like domain-containing protein n=1 Tax=Silvimonas iriomotensis TaxID=449662 RepID=A0ABQ2PDR2_9NEIS|nr:hypothetical protein [Silvimonas iriomotensis]GGP23645.1 hypothetical protein GCM10010970_36450 [Silvimonas iriomotensis]